MMKIESRFPNDNHELLKRVQYKYYYRDVGNLFWYCKERYLDAARLVRMESEKYRQIAEIDRFDHTLLEESHDILAAYYRCKIDLHGQMPIPFDGKSFSDYLEIEWSNFIYKQVRTIAQDNFKAWLIIHIVVIGDVEKAGAEMLELETDLRRSYPISKMDEYL